MTRLLEPYRVERTVRVTHMARSRAIPGAWVLFNDGPQLFSKGVPRSLGAMLIAHGPLDVKVRRFENTQFIERILSIRKAS